MILYYFPIAQNTVNKTASDFFLIAKTKIFEHGFLAKGKAIRSVNFFMLVIRFILIHVAHTCII